MENLDHIQNPLELLQLAVKDMKLVAQDDRYKLDIGSFYEIINDDKKCIVCAAGSIMAKSLPKKIDMSTRSWTERTKYMLYLISDIAFGFGISPQLPNLKWSDWEGVLIQSRHEMENNFEDLDIKQWERFIVRLEELAKQEGLIDNSFDIDAWFGGVQDRAACRFTGMEVNK